MAKRRALLSGGALIVAGLGVLAFAIYKGWIKLPDILGALLPGDVGRGAQEGMASGGLPGAIGGATYNIFTPGGDTLRERVVERYITVAQEEGITEEAAFHKVVAEEAAADVEAGPFGMGFIGAITPGLSGYTIGAGLGALSQWQQYLDKLDPTQRAAARQTEFTQRATWMWKHPIESTVGFPAQIIHEALKPEGAPSAPVVTFLQLVTGLWDRKVPESQQTQFTEVLRQQGIIPAALPRSEPDEPIGPTERRLALPIMLQESAAKLTEHIGSIEQTAGSSEVVYRATQHYQAPGGTGAISGALAAAEPTPITGAVGAILREI